MLSREQGEEAKAGHVKNVAFVDLALMLLHLVIFSSAGTDSGFDDMFYMTLLLQLFYSHCSCSSQVICVIKALQEKLRLTSELVRSIFLRALPEL